MRRVWAAIPAAGVGRRMGADVPKQYLPLCGVPVLAHGLRRLGDHPKMSGVVVALAPGDPYWQRMEVRCRAPLWVTSGGAERCDSVLAALGVLALHGDGDDWVLVHDAARPCLRRADLDCLIETLWDHPVGGLLAVPVGDTLKRAGPACEVQGTVARDGLWQAQTPQMFRLGALIAALEQVATLGGVVTDESQAMERMGLAPRLIEGHAGNIKITRPEDLARAALYLRSQDPGMMRIGHGYDAHRLVAGRRLVLGGVTIPHERGLFAHSDGDALIHAICDALLGAAGLGDIGRHFPDSQSALSGIDSRILLRRTLGLIEALGFQVANVDATVVAQEPKLAPYFAAMRENLAADLRVDPGQVNIKGTTTEGMGFAGRQEGIAAHAVALLCRVTNTE